MDLYKKYLPKPEHEDLVLVQIKVPRALRDAMFKLIKKEKTTWTNMAIALFHLALDNQKK